jgi:hypothetical protein
MELLISAFYICTDNEIIDHIPVFILFHIKVLYMLVM